MANKEDKIVIISLVLLVFLFLLISKTLNSGFHFVDDHEVIKIKNELKSTSLSTVSENWVREDLNNNGRFRPFYYIHRVVETKLLGSDFFLWSLYDAILFCLALIFFYLAMRNLKFELGESIAFLIITFIGPQSSVWWRLGPGESLGMALLGFSFYFMSKSLYERKYQLYNIPFILFLILASLTKESFLIIIPAITIYKIWNEKIHRWSSFKESLYKNRILVIPLIVFVIEIFIIKYYVGTSYSGLDTHFFNFVSRLLLTSLHFVKTYLNLVIAGLLILMIRRYLKNPPISINLLSLAFFLLIIAPNIVLYAKSGLVERYLLPSSLGLGFFVASIIKGIDKDQLRYRKIVLTIITISFLPFMFSSCSEAIKFSKEGYATKRLLSAVSTNYMKGSQLLVIADPVESYEKSVSLKTYLFYEEEIDLFGYPIVKDDKNADYQGFVDGWKSYFYGNQFENMSRKPALLIFLDNKMVDSFFVKSNLLRNEYLPVNMGNSPFALLKKI